MLSVCLSVQTVLVPDHSSANSLPTRIRLTFNVTEDASDDVTTTMTSSVTLDLERNDRVKPTALVVVGVDDGSVQPLDLSYPNVSS